MDTLHVITVATKSEGFFGALKQSARRHNIHLKVLGWGLPWTGFGTRVNWIRDFLETLPPEDVVLLIDAYDVILLQDSATIMRKYKSFDKPLVMSVQRWPTEIYTWLQSRLFFGHVDGYTLNGGAYMGKVWALKELQDAMCSGKQCDVGVDDQKMLNRAIGLSPPLRDKIAIDSNSLLFHNARTESLRQYLACTFGFSSRHRIDIGVLVDAQGRVRIRDSEIYPSILHGPGNLDLRQLLRDLGYPLGIYKSRNYALFLVNNHKREVLAITGLLAACILLLIVWSYQRPQWQTD